MHEPPPVSRDQAPGRRVLLVEDNVAAGKGLERLLQAEGFEVTTVLDGRTALAALASDPPPDFVLTDMQLPDLDGREVASRARHLVPRPRIALITGWDLEPAHGDPAHWGIDWVLTKPVNLDDLLKKLFLTVRHPVETAPGEPS